MEHIQSQALSHNPEVYSLSEAIYNLAQKVSKEIQRRGFSIKMPGSSSLPRMYEMTQSQLTKVYAELIFIEGIFSDPEIEDANDVEVTKGVLQKLRMKVDDEFWSHVQGDDVIELYRDDGVQIYRSFNMFNTTGYSILDLNLYSWDELWLRSSFSTAKINAVVNKVLRGNCARYDFDLQEDFVKEVLNSSLTEPFVPRSLKVKLAQIAPCKDTMTGAIGGFIVTTKCKVVAVGEDSKLVSFI